MSDVLLFSWEILVTLSVFGFAKLVLRGVGLPKVPVAVSGIFGVSLWIALGGYLNAIHSIRPAVLLPLTALGAVAGASFAYGARHHLTASLKTSEWLAFRRSPAVWMFVAAVLILGVLALAGAHTSVWCTDDLEGYIAMARKAIQTHAIQPDFFCERRVQAGVGGGNFLDAWMLAGGDLRAMTFIDSTLGLFLYSAAAWAVCRRFGLSLAKTSFVLLCLPFATLVKVNLTIINLSAAAFLTVLYLLTDFFTDEPSGSGNVLVLGIILGAASTTKTPNITLLFPLLFGAALLARYFRSSTSLITRMLSSLLVAAAVISPYSLQNKRSAGTYLYPLLGNGIHVTAYHLIPAPSKVGDLSLVFIQIAPIAVIFLVLLASFWRLTVDWAGGARAALLAYLAAVILATTATTYGLGGSGAVRYEAPFVASGFLVALAIVLKTRTRSGPRWPLAALSVALLGLYATAFTGVYLHWYRDYKNLVSGSFGLPYRISRYQHYLPERELLAGIEYGRKVQSVIPPGAVAIADLPNSYIFDFARNPIDIQDMAGMASPPPGLPLTGGVDANRNFLLAHGVHYIIFDKGFLGDCSGWEQFLRTPHERLSATTFLQKIKIAHLYDPWSRVESQVACHERSLIWNIAQKGKIVYDDQIVVVSGID